MIEPVIELTDQERVEAVARALRDLLAEYELAGCFFLSAPALRRRHHVRDRTLAASQAGDR